MNITKELMGHPDISLTAQIYTHMVDKVFGQNRNVLNRTADVNKYKAVSEGCKKAYQALVETDDFSLDTDRQARLVRPLAFDLLNDKQTEYAKERLVKAIENYGYRLGTGFLSTPLILGVLDKYDLSTAYRLLENEEMPGWLFMPKNGATTIWESWEGTKAQGGIASLNHYSKGAVCEWLFKSMCGINIDGENHFVIAPKPGGNFTFAKAQYKSIFGMVQSAWEIKDGKTVYTVKIPANTTADIILPNGNEQTVVAGKYEFEV